MARRYCKPKPYRKMANVNNLAEAKANCFTDENCGMFYDWANKGTSFYSCPFTTEQNYRGLRTTYASVVYAKGKLY